MNRGHNINLLKEATGKILDCGNQIGLMHEAVNEMYSIYCEYTFVDTFDQNDEHIILPSGKAISPASAAHCLLEMVRTAKFLRGICKAIQDKQQVTKKVRILYAGCGPYATLITPLLTLFSNRELVVDLLDINEVSLISAKSVINGLGLGHFIENYYLQDASTFKTTNEYDIIISETLQSALRSEPFVAIYQNLIHQVKSECVFIPEEVIVDLKQNTPGKWNDILLKMDNQQRFECGEVLRINKQTVLTELPVIKIDVINRYENQRVELKLYTTVVVYHNQVLTENECSLNLPNKIDELNYLSTCCYEFNYNQVYPAHIEIKTSKTSLESIKY